MLNVFVFRKHVLYIIKRVALNVSYSIIITCYCIVFIHMHVYKNETKDVRDFFEIYLNKLLQCVWNRFRSIYENFEQHFLSVFQSLKTVELCRHDLK